MPPPGGGVGDIVKALQIIEWIWMNCFRESSSADRRYAQFLNDLKQLETALTDLRKVHSTVRLAIEPFENDAKYIAGDFLETVEACKELLGKKSRYKKKAGFVDNVKYGYWDHPQFEGLRGRLLFHAQTLALMTASVDTELLVRIYQDTSELIEGLRFPDGRHSTRPQNLVPAWLADVFKENFALSPPFTFTNFEGVPLREGCLGLRQHFDRLSELANTGLNRRERFILEYIGLLKCSWVIDVLKAGHDFESRRPDEPLRRFVSNVAMEVYQRLKAQARSTEAPITDEELTATQNANSNAFLIWEVPEERKRKLAWEERDGEEKIATISLADDEKLAIFKSSPTTRRMVVIVETEGGAISQSQHHGEVHINLAVDQFIPLYTFSSSGNKNLNVRIYLLNVGRCVDYTLADKKSAWTLHQAITGYKVKADEKEVDLEILRPPFTSPSQRTESSKGRAHAWEWKPMVAAQDPPPPPVEEKPVEESVVDPTNPSSRSLPFTPMISRASTTDSLRSEPSSFFARSSTSRGKSSTFQTSRPSTSTERMQARSSTSTGTIAPSIGPGSSHTTIVIGEQPPVPPVIAFFSRSGDLYTHFHLAMNRDLFIDKLACECGSNEDSCSLMVIRRHDKKQFEIQRQHWDLSPGSSSGSRWLPQASGAGLNDNNAGVDNATCMELRLTFSKPGKRRDYEERLRIIRSDYQQKDEAYENSKIADKIRADRPVRQSTEVYSLASPSSPRMNNSSSRVSLNMLPRIANMSSIQLPYLDQTAATAPPPRQPGTFNNNTNPR